MKRGKHGLGRNQKRALEFARNNQGWHSYAKDRATVAAINGLQARGLVELSPVSRQFRATQWVVKARAALAKATATE